MTCVHSGPPVEAVVSSVKDKVDVDVSVSIHVSVKDTIGVM